MNERRSSGGAFADHLLLNRRDSGFEQTIIGHVQLRDTSSASSANDPRSVRDVHRAGWLKYLVSSGKSSSLVSLNGKQEKYWVIFTVLNEVDPTLEFYQEKQNLGRKTTEPVFTYSLLKCLHVSPSIVINESEGNYEFAVTLDTQTIRQAIKSTRNFILNFDSIYRLSAGVRASMDDWIDTIRDKLRQLNILQPKENYYTKDPNVKWNRMSTMSANRPLPPIPNTAGSNNGRVTSPPTHAQVDPQASSISRNSLGFGNTGQEIANENSVYEPIFSSETSPSRLSGSNSDSLLPGLPSEDGPPPYDTNQLNDSTSSAQSMIVNNDSTLLSLRESQVLKLRKEIAHDNGVRVVVRRKDSLDTIALIDWMGMVWIAGWKQKYHPQLHNTFHIGDRILSVCGNKINNTREAYTLIKAQPLLVEFVLKRVPHGKIFVVKREYEGQELGFTREGNSAIIKEVDPNGLAFSFGLTLKADSPENEGSQCNWILTEINNRHLNLFFKGNEVQERLNAVGREISLLVQPADLIKQLKKQLKQFKNFKDYIVQ